MRIRSPSGLSVDVNANGSLRRFDCDSISLGLFFGNEIEAGPGNLFLRCPGDQGAWAALLGPGSPTRFRASAPSGEGEWGELGYSIALVLAASARAWFWHVRIENRGSRTQQVDLTYAQDLALAPYGAVRLNEFYVSQYLDHVPLTHARHGTMVASRQNQAADGRYPWCLIGSLRAGTSFATDALQFHGLVRPRRAEARRPGGRPAGAAPAARARHGGDARCADPTRAAARASRPGSSASTNRITPMPRARATSIGWRDTVAAGGDAAADRRAGSARARGSRRRFSAPRRCSRRSN